ncbi:MAG: regulatory iron-sulfur-containing complex subunit RicT [Phycisphaerales bacterium]|jgi:cell fate regulator YaaT (PSP1 superfamily)
MPIVPLPQFEQDLAEYTEEQDRLAREKLTPPKTVVCRFGAMKLIGEFRYTLEATPGCGSKLIARTFRGTEMGEMLTSTCPNSGCGKSISRKEMLQYIEQSGGRDFPFYDKGRILRVATHEDLDAQAALEQSAHELKLRARTVADEIGVSIRIVQAEPILGGETLTYYYLAEQQGDNLPGQQKGAGNHGSHGHRGRDPRLQAGDLRDALQKEANSSGTGGPRVEVRPVGARDEARLTADYERCGQHCCCKNFLKVLKPVPMRAAKQQKATLDPLKISGRCGRLMCCLRYEDESYRELAARLPHRKTLVGTSEGAGLVLDTQILTQLVLVKLDFDGREIAVPLEELIDPADAPDPAAKVVAPPPPPARQRRERGDKDESARTDAPARKKKRRRKKKPTGDAGAPTPETPRRDAPAADGESSPGRKKKRRKRRRKKPGGEGGPGSHPSDPAAPGGD